MVKPKVVLGIETSCDETAAAVVQKQGDRIQILSNIVASSADLQAKYGGIIPEQAAREQIKSIIPVIEEALKQSNLYLPPSKNNLLPSTIHRPAIDAIAVTQGPGLIGSLLVGVETAKTLSLVWNKPLIPVNHLMGHFYANWIEVSSARNKVRTSDWGKSRQDPEKSIIIPRFPCVGLLVSGGHTDLILMKNHNSYIYLGGTRDDAAGECFDKCARLLGLPYPGGPEISKLAQKGNPKAFNLPKPMINSNDFDFSFSGLKTAVVNLVEQLAASGVKLNLHPAHTSEVLQDLCASIEQTIIEVLVKKTVVSAQKYEVEQIIVAGGVAANQKLVKNLEDNCKLKIVNCKLFIPPPYLCTDNAAMIASRAFFEKPQDPLTIQADPNLNLYEHLPA